MTEQERQSYGGVSPHQNSAVRADDAGEAVEADEHARVAAHGVEQIHQRRGGAEQRRSRPVGQAARLHGRRQQRRRAGRDDVEQVRRDEVRHQPVVDGAQETVAREYEQHERAQQQRHQPDTGHDGCHHVTIARRT